MYCTRAERQDRELYQCILSFKQVFPAGTRRDSGFELFSIMHRFKGHERYLYRRAASWCF